MRDIYYSHVHVCIFIIVLSLLSNRCCCADPKYEACVPRNCGNKSISFPFYIVGVQPAYCGSPGFNITCDNKYNSLLRIPEDNQCVLIDEIFYDNRTVRVSNTALLRSNAGRCGVIKQLNSSLKLGGGRFNFSNDSRLVLLSNCSQEASLDKYRVSCDDQNFVVMNKKDTNLGVASRVCKQLRSETPIIISDHENITRMNYLSVLQRGFVLKWTATDCSDCKSTGGRCGFDIEHDQFLCFCKDMPHYRNCSSNASSTITSDNKTRTIIIIVAVIVGFGILLLLLACIIKRKRSQKTSTMGLPNDMEDVNSTESLQYDFATIEVATDYFSDSNKLGEGGFGAVYKGTLQSGEEIAVKRLSTGSNQGQQEFKNEVILVAKLQHRNLVRVLGFCFEGTERLLIYEFVPNASLDHFIFDLVKRSYMDWEKRYKIICGIAKGLLYLHEDSRLRIIHRDLKASNVLLDAEMNPKIADFGTARLFNLDETQGMTSKIVGTYGYMAPEYAMYGRFSIKSDVFSFGVLVLEIVSGQKNSSGRNGENVEDLTSFAWKNWREGTASNIIDPILRNNSTSIREMIRCIHIGLLCVQEDVTKRPTMASVMLMLNSSSLTLEMPSKPAFFIPSRIDPELPLLTDNTISRVSDNSENKNSRVILANKKSRVILATAILGASFVLVICLVTIICTYKGCGNIFTTFLSKKTSSDIDDNISYFGVPVFSYKDLEEATHKFDPSKELGDGGYGTVYHGKLKDGREVAVKRLYENNFKRQEQFMNEIEILTRLRHRNLVLLYGSTSHRSHELLLVYEYIPNGTVADHLHGDRAENEPLSWHVRLSIAMETASALAYLHKSDIIHRDVKTNNILLDNAFTVKVADFGLSRLFPTAATHVSTAPQGTPGYVDPEYHQCYQLTDKSDVYSFGVVLIELISSMPAVDISRSRNEINLANLAVNRIQKCAFDELIDPSLGYKSDPSIERMTTSVAELAFRCLQLEKELRPTMDEVYECLVQIKAFDESKIAKPQPSPESENVVLLRNKTFPASPVTVIDNWISSRSTTPPTSEL